MCLPVLIRIQGDRLWPTINKIETVTALAGPVSTQVRSINSLPWLTLGGIRKVISGHYTA